MNATALNQMGAVAEVLVKTYDELKALIEQRGVHSEFGDAGEGWAIEQNPHELATFLVRMQELGVTSCLEIGTGYKGGLSRFLAADMGWRVTSVDIVDYGHKFAGVEYIVGKGQGLVGKLAHKPSFDLVFIDGAHDWDSVAYDYAYYGKTFARKVIAFHDIAGLRDCEGVKQFWDELVESVEYKEKLCTAIAENNYSGIGWAEAITFFEIATHNLIERMKNTPWTLR